MVWVHDTVFRRHNAIHTQNSITRHTYCMWKRAGTIIAYNHWYFKFDNLQRCRDKKKDINISSCVFAVPPPVTCAPWATTIVTIVTQSNTCQTKPCTHLRKGRSTLSIFSATIRLSISRT